MVLMLLYVTHNVCIQVYWFSVEHRMITEKEKRVKDALTITIMVLTLLLLIAWWVINDAY